ASFSDREKVFIIELIELKSVVAPEDVGLDAGQIVLEHLNQVLERSRLDVNAQDARVRIPLRPELRARVPQGPDALLDPFLGRRKNRGSHLRADELASPLGPKAFGSSQYLEAAHPRGQARVHQHAP